MSPRSVHVVDGVVVMGVAVLEEFVTITTSAFPAVGDGEVVTSKLAAPVVPPVHELAMLIDPPPPPLGALPPGPGIRACGNAGKHRITIAIRVFIF
jgi:hypothetical protein